MNALTQTNLDKLALHGCQAPGCKHQDHANRLFFHARCHPGAAIEVSYRYGSHELQITCRECRKPVAKVSVAL